MSGRLASCGCGECMDLRSTIPHDLKEKADEFHGALSLDLDGCKWLVTFHGGASGDDRIGEGSSPSEAFDAARKTMAGWL